MMHFLTRILFMFICCLLLKQGMSQQPRISIELSNSNLLKVVNKLQEQMPAMHFSFQPSSFEKIKIEKVSVKAGSLEEALSQLKKQCQLDYLIDGETVALKFSGTVPVAEKKTALNGNYILRGRVVDMETTAPLPGASVKLEGTNKAVVSDEKGYYVLAAVGSGEYTLTVTYTGYSRFAEVVKVNGNTSFDVSMQVGGNAQLSEVVVNAAGRKTRNVTHTTEKAVIAEIKSSQSVISGISSEQISKSADRNASEAVRKIAGVSVRDDKFIVIRGLNERYNLTYLNNNIAPSTEVYSRAFSLDLLPTRIIDRIIIYKSPAPDLLADMTGGAVKIFTKDAATVKHFDVEVQLGVRPGTAFNDQFLTYKGSSTDGLGFDGGTRKLPSSIPGFGNFTRASISQKTYAETFSPTLQYGYKTALPLMQVTGNYYNSFKVGHHSLSMLTSLSYKNESQQLNINRIQSNFLNNERTHNIIAEIQSQQVAQVTLLQNFSYRLKDSGRLVFKNYLLQQGSSGTVVRTSNNNEQFIDGAFKPNQSGTGVNERNIILGYTQRFLYSGNFGGNHYLGSNHHQAIDWNIGYTYSKQSIPDQRVVRLQSNRKDYSGWVVGDPDLHWIAAVRNLNTGSETGGNDVQRGIISRTWSENTENSYNASINYSYKLKPWITLKAGTYQMYKTRVQFRRVYTVNEGDLNSAGFPEYASLGGNGQYIDYNRVFFKQQDLAKIWSNEYLQDDGSALKVYDRTGGSDAYTASQQNNSGYLAVSLLPVKSKMDIYGGLRVEYDIQKVTGAIPQGQTASPTQGGVNTPILINNEKLSWLPSVNISYRPNDRWVARAGYGKTINRPEFRELSPYSELDYLNNQLIYGNNQLVSADISNYDLRLEWYPKVSSTVSIGAFYKDLINPIERITTRNFYYNAPAGITFTNADKAIVKGLELDIRQSLDFISGKWFRNLSIIANGTLVSSDVNRKEQSNVPVGSAQNADIKRQLQGQAPYIINAGLYYDNAGSGTKVAIIYNEIGPRIYAAAVGAAFDPTPGGTGIIGSGSAGSLIELTRRQLDLSITQRLIKSLQLKFSAQNLLNQPIQMAEDENFTYKYEKATFSGYNVLKGDPISSSYRSDRLFNLSISYSF